MTTASVRDLRTQKVRRVNFSQVGDFLFRTRRDTPSELPNRDGACCSRVELVDLVNRRLLKDELPITDAIVSRIERGDNRYGGYLMRIFQMARALECDLILSHKKTGSVSLFT